MVRLMKVSLLDTLNSKAFRVFSNRTRIVEEKLHIRFSENTPNVVGSGPDWLFDIDALTRIMNCKPIIAGTQFNGFVGTKTSDNAGQARKEIEPVKNYILLPLWLADLPFSQDPKSFQDDGSKPSSDDEKKVGEDPRKDSKSIDQEKDDNVNSTNNVNATSINKVNVVSGKTSIKLPDDPNMHDLEDISIFNLSRDNEDVGAEADMNNLDITIQMSYMGELIFFLGLQVQQKKNDIFISQEKYVEEILKKFGFTEVKTASTPIETQNPLLKDENDEEVDVHMYRYQVNPKVLHLHAMKRIFRDYAIASLDRNSTIGEPEYVAALSCCG
ncbi:ribonuclease H-like domain-containing protein [Tanacetum coccineum]